MGGNYLLIAYAYDLLLFTWDSSRFILKMEENVALHIFQEWAILKSYLCNKILCVTFGNPINFKRPTIFKIYLNLKKCKVLKIYRSESLFITIQSIAS